MACETKHKSISALRFWLWGLKIQSLYILIDTNISFIRCHFKLYFIDSNFYKGGWLKKTSCKDMSWNCHTNTVGLLVLKLFLTEQSANFRNQYMSYKELKTGFGISLSQTGDLPHFCPRSPRTGSATGYVGRTGANPPFDLEKFRKQFWASYCSCIHSWNSQINPRLDQEPY